MNSFHFFTNSGTIYLKINEVKFMQVINNLLSNAIKFTADGGEITVRVEDQQDHVLITVEDNGIGIPAHLQSQFGQPRGQIIKIIFYGIVVFLLLCLSVVLVSVDCISVFFACTPTSV